MKLRQIRESKNLTQKQLAEVIGFSSSVYSRYENGSRQPSFDVLIKLADYLEVSVDTLIGHNTKENDYFSEYEKKLIQVSRLADKRARADALALLELHAKKKENS